MMVQSRLVRIEYLLRVGVGPRWEPKMVEYDYDDCPMEDWEVERDAIQRFEVSRKGRADYAYYGKNWKITEVTIEGI